MRKIILSLLTISLISSVPQTLSASAEGAYAKAKACYGKLKAGPDKPDPIQWEHCIDMFLTVQKKYPKDELGINGLYNVGKLKVELYSKLKRTSDADEAIKAFNQFIKDYPDSHLADDALFEIAKLRHNPFKQDDRALLALDYIIQNYPNSDMVPAAEEMLKKLQGTQTQTASKDSMESKNSVKEENLSKPSSEGEGETKIRTEAKPVAGESYAGPDNIAFLGSVGVEDTGDGTQVVLSLSRKATYSLTFEQEGPRTKSPPALTVYLPYTKATGAVTKVTKVDSSYLKSIEVSKGVLSGGAKLKFEMKPGATYDISTKGEKIILKFKKGNTSEGKAAAKNKAVAKSSEKPVTIVVDPGHGGKDTGAIGKRGLKEKDVVLSISKRVARKLKDGMGAKVFLTRTKDQALTLEDRDAFAVSKKADLFLSIHANASPNRKMSGIETYYLNNATDKAAEKLALRENRSAGKKLSDVEHILSTMLQNYDAAESELLAKDVQKALVRDIGKVYKGVANRKVRSALFYVLVGAKCPAILVETSFISNPLEERRLNDPKYQEALAVAIAGGVKNYLSLSDKRSVTL